MCQIVNAENPHKIKHSLHSAAYIVLPLNHKVSLFRIKRVLNVYKEMEKDLTLLGATGVEDKLQDEVVPTLDKMQKAGITTWMLTGDKKETAINMAFASGMVKHSDNEIDLCHFTEVSELYSMVDEIQDETSFYANGTFVVLNDKIVSAIFKSDDCKTKISDVFSKCNSVIACRLSPIQKSELVTMMKNANPKNITCAIGDGGNDVSMIQEAHVGLGNHNLLLIHFKRMILGGQLLLNTIKVN